MTSSKQEKLDSGALKGRIIGLLKLAVVVGAVLMIVAFFFGRIVLPGTMGVRQITLELPIGPKAGLATEGLPPGLHWNIPFYSKVYIVPQSIQILHLHRKSNMSSEGAVEVQTTDGSSVLVDVSVLSRFFDSSGEIEIDGKKYNHGGPGDLLKELGASTVEWTNTLRRDAVDEIKRALGSLSTSEFYDPHLREKQLLEAKNKLGIKLAPYGIKIEDLLLRRYTYTEERIDQAIFAKNLQEAEERLNKAASALADARATVERTAAEMDAKIKTLDVEGQNKAKVVKSEADLYEAQRTADGDLLYAKAKAEVDRLRASILANTAGAENYVAREMAPLVSSLEGGIVSNIDPYDIDAWMKRFGFKEAH